MLRQTHFTQMHTVYNGWLLLHEHADHVIYWYFISLKLKQNARTKTNFEVTFSAARTKKNNNLRDKCMSCLEEMAKLAHNLFSYLLKIALLPSLPTAAALVYLFAVYFSSFLLWQTRCIMLSQLRNLAGHSIFVLIVQCRFSSSHSVHEGNQPPWTFSASHKPVTY